MAARRGHRHGKQRRFSRLLFWLAIAVLLLYPFFEATRLNQEYVTIQNATLPQPLNSLKIAFVTDIQLGSFFSESRAKSLIATINAMKPDIVLFGGDYGQDSTAAIRFFQCIPRIQARLFVAGVLGEDDRTPPADNFDKLRDAMTSAGVWPLINEVRAVKVGTSYLYIAGVDDVTSGQPDVAGVAAQVREQDFVVFLAHSPDILPQVQAARDKNGSPRWYDLALMGHTHGGQVTPLGMPLFQKIQVGSRYLSGWVEESRANILVSNGVGTSGLPIRLFAPPQVHLITLKTK